MATYCLLVVLLHLLRRAACCAEMDSSRTTAVFRLRHRTLCDGSDHAGTKITVWVRTVILVVPRWISPSTTATTFRRPRGTLLATRATMMVQLTPTLFVFACTSVRTGPGAIPSQSLWTVSLSSDGFSDDMAVSGAVRAAVSFTVSTLRFQGNMVQDPVHMSAHARHPELSMCPSVASTGAQVEGRIF